MGVMVIRYIKNNFNQNRHMGVDGEDNAQNYKNIKLP